MKVTYTGGPLGARLLPELLRGEGLDPHYDPPIEERGAGQAVVHFVLWIAEETGSAMVGAGALAAAHRAVAKLRERFPRDQVDIDEG